MTIPSFLIVCRTCDQCQVLSRGLYLKCQIEYRVPLPGICHFLVWTWSGPSPVFWGNLQLLYWPWNYPKMSEDNSGQGQGRIQYGVTFCWAGSSPMAAFCLFLLLLACLVSGSCNYRHAPPCTTPSTSCQPCCSNISSCSGDIFPTLT
jgi:hypothetical protein